jgi:hypothetical protein
VIRVDRKVVEVAGERLATRIEQARAEQEAGRRRRAGRPYLRDGRPRSADGERQVFLRVRAPHDALTSGGVTQAVAAAARRAGLGTVHAHRLRHSRLVSMTTCSLSWAGTCSWAPTSGSWRLRWRWLGSWRRAVRPRQSAGRCALSVRHHQPATGSAAYPAGRPGCSVLGVGRPGGIADADVIKAG